MIQSRRMLCFGILLFLALPPGCGGQTDVVAKPVLQVTESAATEFGKALEARIADGDVAGANALVDWDELVVRATAGLGTPVEFRQGMSRRAREGESGSPSQFDQFATMTRNGGGFQLLRVHDIEGQRRALFRILDGHGMVGYLEFVLSTAASGETRAVDIFVMQSAELMSQSLRRITIPILAGMSPSLSQRLNGTDRDIQTSMKILGRVTSAVRSSPAEALRLYKQLPESMQREKAYLLLRMHAAQKVSDDEYGAAMDEFVKYHPHDPAVDFLTIDRESVRKNYSAVSKAIDRLDRRVGGDPYLQVLRANVLIAQELYHEANEPLDAGMRADPTLKPLHVAKVRLANIVSDFELAAKHCTILRELHTPLAEVETNAEYAAFRKSEPYRLYRNAGIK